jgi:hypothetical protein
MARILFYPSGTRELPSSHLRVYETAGELEKLGHKTTIVDPDITDDNKRIYLNLAEPGTIVYVQKIAQTFHKPENFAPFKNKFKIVYDVDDYHEGQDTGMVEVAHQIVAGSHFVADFCKRINKNVEIACSITDTEVYGYVDRSKRPTNRPIQIIWTESYANAYLEDLSLIQKPMQKMYDKYKIRFVLQGIRENRHIRNPKYQNLIVKFIHMFPYCIIQKFLPINEYLVKGVQIIKDSDIGVIPFKADRVGKAAQNMRSLMSVGLGVIGTPGNEHEYVIESGRSGLLASSEAEWEEALEMLITNQDLRLTMGSKASQHINATYSRPQYIKRITQILDL